MANLPNDPFTPVPAPPATNPDLPGGEFPSLSRIETTDLVGPGAANRQHAAVEKRTLALRDRINKVVDFLNALDGILLRNDGSTPKVGAAGFHADIPANGHTLTGLRQAVANGEPVRYEEFQALFDLIAGRATMPSGMVAAFPGHVAPNGWVVADGATYTTSGIVYSDGSTGSYPGGLSWGSMDGLRNYLGTTWGGDGLSSFRVPDYRGRVIVGVGTGVVGGALTTRYEGQYGGSESENAPLAAHAHWMFNDNNYGATSWGLSIGAGDTRGTAIRSNSGVGGGSEKYHMNVAGEADRLKTSTEGTPGSSHNNMQPFATALVCLKV